MADSPRTDGPVQVRILTDGQALPEAVQIVSVVVERELDRVASATLVLLDGNMPDGTFPVSDDTLFRPGKTVRIEAGYGDRVEPLFEGPVVRHGIAVSGDNYARLEVICQDAAVALTVGRRCRLFEEVTDADVIQNVAQEAGLDVSCDATPVTHAAILQHDCSDWDFLLSRADANGLVVATDDGTLRCAAPAFSDTPVLTLTWGVDLQAFEGHVDARTQYASVTSHAWDPKSLEVVDGSAPAETGPDQGDLEAGALAEVLGLDAFRLRTPAPLGAQELARWAKAQQVRSALARVRGRMAFQGSARVRPGVTLEVRGVGARLEGTAYVGAVRHEIADGAWTTHARFGLGPERYAERPGLRSPDAAGRLPGISGLHVGVVRQLDEDPEGLFRIQVDLPALEDRPSLWARHLTGQASEGFGTICLPHVGDEVVVGFFNDDPAFPVVLGALYSASRAPAQARTPANTLLEVRSKEGLRATLDDEKKEITVETPAGNRAVLSDERESIRLEDQNGNSATLDASGITLESPKDITLKATGSIALEASQDVTASGMNVQLDGQMGFKASGGGQAELSGGATTTISGALVKIN